MAEPVENEDIELVSKRISDDTVSHSEADDHDESTVPTSSETPELGNCLHRFREPKQSESTRKRKIRQNGPKTRRRKSRSSCSSDPKSVTPAQRVLQFPNKEFARSAGKLFCNAYREELSLKN